LLETIRKERCQLLVPREKKKTGGEAAVEDVNTLLATFDATNEDLYKFSDEDLETWISELQTATASRTPEEIDQANASKFNAAVKNMQFARLSSTKAVLSMEEVKDSDKVTTGVGNDAIKLALQTSVVFAFVHGNVTSKKLWFKISKETEANPKALFASLPSLNSVGSRSVLVHVFREDISKFLASGKTNSLKAVLDKAKVTVKPEKVKFLFPKGHLLQSSKEEIAKVRADLNNIFEQMKQPVDKRKFELKWFSV